MDVKEWITKGLERPGKTQRGLAKALGIDPTAVNRLVKGTRKLQVGELATVARYLEIEVPKEFGTLAQVALREPPNRETPSFVRPGSDMVSSKRDLPILGYAKGGTNAFFIDNGEIGGYTMRPEMLVGVTDAYAIEFWDVSMEPVFKHGHLGWVHPRKPVKPGDDVVVQLNDGQAFVKTLVRRTDKHLILSQYSDKAEIKIEQSKVRSVHLIVGTMRVAM